MHERPQRRLAALATAALSGMAACQSTVAVPVQPVTLVAVGQHQNVRVATKADVLFVVDDSLSMVGKQDRLSQALAGFTQKLDALDPPVDYQAAVVTTSIAERFGACGPAGDPAAAAQCSSDWAAPGFLCDKDLACLRTFDAIAGKLHQGPLAPQRVLRRRDYTAAQFANYLASSIGVGDDGARQDQGLEAMKRVLTDASTGFVRDNAKIVVAFVSDAEDCSDPERRFSALVRDATGKIVDRCAQESAGTYQGTASLEPVSRYVSFLRDLKNSDGSAKEVQVGAFVSLNAGTQDPGLCRNATCEASCDAPAGQQLCVNRCAGSPTLSTCLADCKAECHDFCGGQVPGRRYVEMALSFSGFAANICNDDASGPLGRLAQVIGIPTEVLLVTRPASPELLRVQVERGGRTIECVPGEGFVIVETPEGPAVRFLGECTLRPDDTFDLRYLANR